MPKPNSPTAFTDHVSTVSAASTNANNTLWYNALTNYVLFNDVADTITVAHTFSAGANFANGTFNFSGGTVTNLTTANPTFTGTVTAAAVNAAGAVALASTLGVTGQANFAAGVALTTDGAQLTTTYAGNTASRFSTDVTGGLLQTDGNWPLRLRTNGVDRLTISGAGAVALSGATLTGSTASGFDLHVVKTGTGAIDGSFYAGNDKLGVYDYTNSRDVWFYIPSTSLVTVSQVLQAAAKVVGLSGVTSGAGLGDFILGNSYNLRSDVSGTTKQLIGMNGTSGVVIDGSGVGATFGSTVTAASGITAPLTGIVNVGTGTGAAGRIYKTAANGTIIRLAGGSSTDFAILDPSGNSLATVLAGALNIRFEGTITTPGSVNSDTLTAVTSATITGVNGSSALTLTHGNLVVSDGSLTVSTTITASGDATGNLILPHRTAPGLPANGALWTTTAGLFVRINGVTVGPLS